MAFVFRLAGYRIWYFEELTMRHYMPASRIDWGYAQEMFTGFGDAEYVFDLYRSAIGNQGLLYAWFLVLLRIFFFAPLLIVWRVVSLHPENEGNIRYLSYLARRAHIRYAFAHLHETIPMYKNIMELRKKLADRK